MIRYGLFLFLIILRIVGYTQNIRFSYLGHSSFVIQFDDITVVTDYGKPNAWKEWGWDSPINDINELVPDIMTFSHLHDDHFDSTRIPSGVKYILKDKESLEYADLKIVPIPTCEDQFGVFNNTSYLFFYKGFSVMHTGDIQTMISNIEQDSIADYFKKNYPVDIDLLIMPVEGKIKYIPQAEKFLSKLNPRFVILCHYWSQQYLDDFVFCLKSSKYYSFEISVDTFSLVKENSSNPCPKIIVLKSLPYISD